MNLRAVGARESVRLLPLPQFAVGHRAAHPGRGLVSEDLALCARVLHISCAQLATELDGRSIAEVADDHEIPPSLIVDALLTRSLVRVAASVDSGNVSLEYSLEAFTRLAERALYRVYRPVRMRLVC